MCLLNAAACTAGDYAPQPTADEAHLRTLTECETPTRARQDSCCWSCSWHGAAATAHGHAGWSLPSTTPAAGHSPAHQRCVDNMLPPSHSKCAGPGLFFKTVGGIPSAASIVCCAAFLHVLHMRVCRVCMQCAGLAIRVSCRCHTALSMCLLFVSSCVLFFVSHHAQCAPRSTSSTHAGVNSGLLLWHAWLSAPGQHRHHPIRCVVGCASWKKTWMECAGHIL